jgi:hypothetical protein
LRSLIIKSMVALKSIHFDVNITNHFPYFAKVTIILQVITGKPQLTFRLKTLFTDGIS